MMKKVIEIIKDWDGDFILEDRDAIRLWNEWEGHVNKPGDVIAPVNLSSGGFVEEFISLATSKGYEVVFLAGNAIEPPTVGNEVV